MGLLYLPLQTFRRIRSVLQDSQNQPGSQQWVHPRIHTPHIDLLRPTAPPRQITAPLCSPLQMDRRGPGEATQRSGFGVVGEGEITGGC